MMKKILLFCLCLPFIVAAQKTVSGTILSDNLKRSYRIYLPKAYTGDKAVPLVFNFHGYSSNNTQQEFYGDFRPIADTANFLVVHPLGTAIQAGNLGWNNFTDLNMQPNDIKFMRNLIDSLSVIYKIDKNKIYSTGMSNGGFMSYDAACFVSDKIAAIASVTGSMIAARLPLCQMQHPTPIMEIHGTTDVTIPYDGKGPLVESVHIDSLISFWVKQNKCSPVPTKKTLPDINTSDKCTAEHYVYSKGRNGVEVEFYKIIGGGHTWPGSTIPIPGVNTNRDFKASEVIWQFFRKYSLNKLTSDKESIVENKDYAVFPNPNDGTFSVQSFIDNQSKILIINNIGQSILEASLSEGVQPIDLTPYPKGIYFYQIQNAGKAVKAGKIIKQ